MTLKSLSPSRPEAITLNPADKVQGTQMLSLVQSRGRFAVDSLGLGQAK